MKKMLYCLALFVLFALPALLQAQMEPMQLGWQEFPIAGIDNLFIPYSNPSLLGTGNSNGLGIVHLANEDQFEKHYWLIVNADFLTYAYERDHGIQHHMLAMGDQLLPDHILPNLYYGSNYRWKSDAFKDGIFRNGFTYRPHDSSSLAFTWDNPIHGKPFYRAGLAIRPLAFVKSMDDYRLELSADVNYSYLQQGDKYEISKPILGINTQLLDGVKIGATYNLEEETALLSFSLSSRKSEIGGLMRMKDYDNWGYGYLHLTDANFKPFLGLSPKSWYKMSPKGQIVSYRAPKYTLGPVKVFDSATRSIESVIEEINKAAQDPAVNGLLFKDPSFSTSFALQQELVDALKEFKTTGKHISFYYNNISNGSYIFAASVADKIYLNPNGIVDLRGLSITSPYLKGMLSSLGIEPMNFRSHKYKNAGNMFSETEMTAAEREVYDALLQSIYDQMIAQINVGRGERLNAPVETVIDQGPYFIPSTALKAGLVDKIIYEDELSATLKQDFQFSMRNNELANYRSYDWSKPKETLVATIYASGNIVMGKGTPGQKIAHETTVNLIRAARKNPMYKGILLRVDSGGGSAQASDIILRELELAKTENKKPVVVSMAGVAASGGYYISAYADKIVANPATFTGSIGVIGLMFNATEMFKKIKVNWSTVKKGENADFGSMFRPWTVAEKKLLEGYIEHTYNDFLSKVDAGRPNLDLDEIHELAQGRVWTGEQAKNNGLIDDLGGMDVALKHLKEIAKIKGPIRAVDATSSASGINVNMQSNSLIKALKLDAVHALNSEYLKIYELWNDFAGEKALLLSPIDSTNLQY